MIQANKARLHGISANTIQPSRGLYIPAQLHSNPAGPPLQPKIINPAPWP